jgi:hypothetical protein
MDDRRRADQCGDSIIPRASCLLSMDLSGAQYYNLLMT